MTSNQLGNTTNSAQATPQATPLAQANAPQVQAQSFKEAGTAVMESIGNCLNGLKQMIQDRVAVGIGMIAVTLDPKVSLQEKVEAYRQGAATLKEELGQALQGSQQQVTNAVKEFNSSQELRQVNAAIDKQFSKLEKRISDIEEKEELSPPRQRWLQRTVTAVGTTKQQLVERITTAVEETRDNPAERKQRLEAILTEAQNEVKHAHVGLDRVIVKQRIDNKLTETARQHAEFDTQEAVKAYGADADSVIDGSEKGLKDALRIVDAFGQDIERRVKIGNRIEALRNAVRQTTQIANVEFANVTDDFSVALSDGKFTDAEFSRINDALKKLELPWHQDIGGRVAHGAAQAVKSVADRLSEVVHSGEEKRREHLVSRLTPPVVAAPVANPNITTPAGTDPNAANPATGSNP